MRAGSRAGAAIGVLLVVLTSGCAFLDDLAHPQEPDAEATTAAPVAAAPTAPGPPVPRVIVDGDLLTSGGGPAGRLVVSVGAVETGLVPPVPIADFGDACSVEGRSLQYVPIDFATTSAGVAAHLEIGTGPDTPADVCQVVIFVESGNGSQDYCADAPPMPTSDRFWNPMGAPTVTAWVVLDDAVTPATPGGRPEVFPTLQLRISDLRRFSDPTVQHGLVPGALGVGSPCADDADAICVPLG